MKTVPILLVILLSISFLSCQRIAHNSYEIKKGSFSYGNTGNLSYIDDLYNNGYPEFIHVTNNTPPSHGETIIDLVDLKTNVNIFSDHVPYALSSVRTFDLMGKKTKQLIYTYKKGNSVFLKVKDPFADGKIIIDKEIVRGKSTKEDKFWDGNARIDDFADLNGDGIPEILLGVVSYFDRSPRGIYAFEIVSKKILWKYKTGPFVGNIRAIDLNKDGLPEIIFNTSAPGNGNQINGTNDFHSYFIILNNKGKLLFQKELGGEAGSTVVIDNETGIDKYPDLYTFTYSGNISSFKNHPLIRWNVSNLKNIKATNINSQIYSFYSPKIELFKMSPHFFLMSPDTTIYILNGDLSIAKKIKSKHLYTQLLGRYDLNDDGRYEYIWREVNGIGITDDNFNEIANIPGAINVFKAVSGKDLKPEYYLLTNKGEFYDFNLENISEISFLTKNKYYLAIFILLGLNVVLFFLWMKKSNWKNAQNQFKLFDDTSSSIALFSGKGKLVTFNDKFKQFVNNGSGSIKNIPYGNFFQNEFLDIKNWIDDQLSYKLDGSKRFQIKSDDNENVIQVNIKFFKSVTGSIKYFSLIINDITPIIRSEQNTLWLSVAQKLAHEIKNPLTTIRLTLQRFKMEYEDKPEKYQELLNLLDGSIDDAERVRNVVNDFMRFSKIEEAKIKRINLAEAISELHKRYQLTVPEGVGIKVEAEKDLPEINGDESQLLSALTNILDNSLQAIEPPGEVIIRLNYNERITGSDSPIKDFIEIEIEDSGCGIDESVMQKIFEPFFTTKEGGSGLGLIIAKKIIEDHSGTMEIFSKKGLGTKVSIILPAVSS